MDFFRHIGMKTFYFSIFILAVLCTSALRGQGLVNLSEVLGPEKFATLQANYPERIDFLTFFNRHGYYVADLADEKSTEELLSPEGIEKRNENLPDLTTELAESGELNLMGYSFKLLPDRNTYYTLPGGKVLVILSLNQAEILFNETPD
jgi:hypothetical protein